MKTIAFTLLTCFWSLALTAQPAVPITLKNPSFEDAPHHSHTPKGWDNCGFDDETPPDVHPTGEFGVTLKAAHGKTYLGMVVRDNDTWECVGQSLPQPLLSDACYRLSFRACRSGTFINFSRAKQEQADYVTPCVIRILGGYVDKERGGFEMLAATEPIANTDWEEYALTFTSTAPYDYLYLEAYFGQGLPHPYNGNVMVDALSAILPCSPVK